MPSWEGLTGPTYAYENKYAAIERCMEFYVTANESPEETKFKLCLDQCPANGQFSTLPVPPPFNQPIIAMLEFQGFAYALFGIEASGYGTQTCHLARVETNGSYTELGASVIPTHTIGGTGPWMGPGTMVGTGAGQIFINVGTNADENSSGPTFVYTVSGNTVDYVSNDVSVPGGGLDMGLFGCLYATFQDGYVLCISAFTGTPETKQFQISGTDAVPLGDVRYWNPANVSIQAGQADGLVAIISTREYIRLFGEKRSQVLYNAAQNGLGGFPFQSYNETFIEVGLGARWSLAELPDSLVWIGKDSRGTNVAWRDFGFQPQRISTFAIEQFWQSYGQAVIESAVSFPYMWKGHLFWQITFPGVATWVYDATVSQLTGRSIWHERRFQKPDGTFTCRPEMFHCYAYGKHLVGSGGADGNPGAIYQYSDVYADCASTDGTAQLHMPQVPFRTAPHLYNGTKRGIVSRIAIDGYRPMLLQKSNTGDYPTGRIFLSQQMASCPTIHYFGRMGVGRDFVFTLTGDGTANPNGIISGEIEGTPLSA